jgi:uncharacterized protein (DUF1501 family)
MERQRWNRREFLASAGPGAALLLLSSTKVPSLFQEAALWMDARGTAASNRRILVLLQLTGGNDGLNTVIPYADDAYHAARPTLAIPRAQVLRLDDHLGLPPALSPLKELHDQGQLAVVENVGYPHPNRSHFASMDIWHTASVAEVRSDTTGWIGRVVDRETSDVRLEADPTVIHVDREPVPLLLTSRHHVVPSFADASSLRLGDAETEGLEKVLARSGAGDEGDLAHITAMGRKALYQARRLADLLEGETSTIEYPASPLARSLEQIARLIAAGLSTRIYSTSLSGFDTHSIQAETHRGLLSTLGAAIAAFQRDLHDKGLADEVLVLTFSEFGRRIRENRSRGTDHGTAAPLFLVGRNVVPGIVGGKPDLETTEDGDLVHTIDFRRVYASVLESWLGVPSVPILGGSWEPLEIVARV